MTLFTKPTVKSVTIIGLLTIGVSAGIFALQTPLLGTRPTEYYKPQVKSPASHSQNMERKEYTDPALLRLKRATKSYPNDVKAWKAYALGLSEKLKTGQVDQRQAAFDLVDALSKVLSLDPDDTDAILLTADLSFDLKAFAKAKEFYERYFRLVPDDSVASARYASTLTFLGEVGKAEKILKDIIKKDPKNFQAHAFLAIAYVQQGKTDLARSTGKTALKYAPSPEAKTRFETFLKTIGKEKKNAPPLIQALKSNPIAGPKLVEITQEGTTLIASMRDFPMHLMPPIAKDKFVASLNANRGKFTEVRFIDFQTEETLDTVSLVGNNGSELKE